ncbi:mandelate racemase/muconate lactonizing enzyme family protein [Halobellus salinisoli]|uniref:mandelate racemase/muconate lactonizing enzyme family protein n=1 Tax=Halobellus salinisoli TaxID=3108500 RepID=UPI00300908AE
MEITSIDATTVTVPVELPPDLNTVEFTIVLVSVETNTGVVGYGETGMVTPEATVSYIEQQIAPRLIGRDPIRTGHIWTDLQKELNPRTQTGVWSTAVSAVDIALWDIKGKHYGDPIWRLLGGASETLPVYVTVGGHFEETETLIEAVEKYVSDGFNRIKIRVGEGTPPDPLEDAKRITAVREAIGPEVELMIDANYQYSFSKALELCNLIEDVNLTWFEEPVYANDASLLSDLRTRTTVPIAAGQNEGSRHRHNSLIESRSVDISQPNVCFVGGFTEGVKVAATAESSNILLAHGGGWPFQNMHLYAGIPNGWRLELHDIVWNCAEKVYQSIPEIADGSITLPEAPGIGLEPDEEAIK